MLARQIRVLSLLAGMGSLASADNIHVVPFTLTTTGSFSAGVPKDLAFVGSPGFSGASDGDGFLALSGLGMFTLTRPAHGSDVYHENLDSFTLNLAITVPGGIHQTTVFDATVGGKVNRTHDSVFIDFGSTRNFTFSNSLGSGSFDVTIDDLLLTLPTGASTMSQALTGSITNAVDPPAPVPEPQTVVLFGTTVLLTGFACRRRMTRRN